MTSHAVIPGRPRAESGVALPPAGIGPTNNEFNGLDANLVVPSGCRFIASWIS